MDKYIWLIPLLPLAGFIINGLGRNTLSKGVIGFIGSTLILASFILSIANSTQYGNDVHISPKSSLNDGLLEVCIVKPLPWYKLPILGYEMLRSKTHRSNWVEIISGKKISIVRAKENAIHIDGEPFFMGMSIEIEIIPKALNVITAK